MRAQLASLPPLHVPKMSGVTKDGVPPDPTSGSLYRKTDLLLSNLLKMSAEVRVVDITGKTSGGCVCVCVSVRERRVVVVGCYCVTFCVKMLFNCDLSILLHPELAQACLMVGFRENVDCITDFSLKSSSFTLFDLSLLSPHRFSLGLSLWFAHRFSLEMSSFVKPIETRNKGCETVCSCFLCVCVHVCTCACV